MRQTSLNCVYELAKKDPRIFFVGSDLGIGTLQKFKEEMPDRFFMEGVSEAHIIGMCAGMAMEGKIPYFNTITTFISRRAYEQCVLDLCLHNLKVRLIGSGGGLVYAPLGPTHLAIEDMAILRTVPNMTIVAPCDAEEMKRLIPLTVDYPGPIYIRLAKGGDPVVSDASLGFEIGKAVKYKTGKDCLVITTGITLKMALEAEKALDSEDISLGILHMPTVKPLDKAAILQAAAGVKAVICIEEGVIEGGLGSAVAETLMESDQKQMPRFRRIGIPDKFPDKYGSQDSLMKSFGISAENLAATVKSLL